MVEELDQRARSRDVAPEGADRFRQRAHLDVDATVNAEVIDRSAAVLSEHPAGLRVVDHHHAAELFGDGTELGKRAQAAWTSISTAWWRSVLRAMHSPMRPTPAAG